MYDLSCFEVGYEGEKVCINSDFCVTIIDVVTKELVNYDYSFNGRMGGYIVSDKADYIACFDCSEKAKIFAASGKCYEASISKREKIVLCSFVSTSNSIIALESNKKPTELIDFKKGESKMILPGCLSVLGFKEGTIVVADGLNSRYDFISLDDPKNIVSISAQKDMLTIDMFSCRGDDRVYLLGKETIGVFSESIPISTFEVSTGGSFSDVAVLGDEIYLLCQSYKGQYQTALMKVSYDLKVFEVIKVLPFCYGKFFCGGRKIFSEDGVVTDTVTDTVTGIAEIFLSSEPK